MKLPDILEMQRRVDDAIGRTHRPIQDMVDQLARQRELLVDAPARRLAEEVQRQTARFEELTRRPFEDYLARQRELQERIARSFMLPTSLVQKFVGSLGDDIRRQVEAAARGPAEALRASFQAVNPEVLAAVDVGREWMRRLGDPSFGETLAGRLEQAIDDIARAEEDLGRRRGLEELRETLREHVESAPHGTISRAEWIEIIIAIVFHLLMLAVELRDHRTDESRVEEIHAFCVAAVRDAQQLPEARLEPTHVVRADRVNLRAGPSTKSVTIGRLHEGQPVTRTAKRREWAYVTYFDYADGIRRSGWVFSKYTKRVQVSVRLKRSATDR